ncbi:hypothetical protein GTW43_19495 [Streptomyces sp. SID5785]|uniref:DUF6274 family protein n=1 Tax=Streptomyces sp. SID5785 TaxID=2690309 RepID=UPI00136173B7|nr:DUF6274 family protein [Streptomyces sp. SID5785]MZD07251.1 hypothetical protein [Streptomyces sp. SID5785]
MAAPARHETRALLRAHLAAASGYRHLTRHCPICHRLLRLALEPGAEPAPEALLKALTAREGPPEGGEDESPPKG